MAITNFPAARGFTLVELVVVMAVLGILAVGSVYFIRNSSDGYAAVRDREQLAARGRFALERMARHVRNALPGSVRVSGDCLELIPIVSGGAYLTLPVAVARPTFKAVPPAVGGLDGNRAAVAATSAAYALGTPGQVSPPVAVGAVDGNGEVTVTFAAAHRFPRESANNRFFWVGEPVSYCADGGNLWRYQNYGFNVAQPTPPSLPGALPDRSMLAESVAAAFAVSPPTLQRNAVVDIDMVMTAGNVSLDVEASVQVRNVP